MQQDRMEARTAGWGQRQGWGRRADGLARAGRRPRRVAMGAMLLVAGIAWTAQTLGANTTPVCKLSVCWASEADKLRYECDSGCYFESNPVDVEPEAVCNVMAEATHEGSFSYMYRDSVNLVTTGIGNLLASVDDAVALPFMIEENGVSRRATEQEIRDAYNGLSSQSAECIAGNPRRCNTANSYAGENALRLEEDTINQLCQTRLANEFTPGLHRIYPDFDSYPSKVQAALYDMVYNLGEGGLSPPKWPSFNRAMGRKDWQGAADESNRPQLGTTRNDYVRDLLESAADEEEAGRQRLASCASPGFP
ncbi:hypothetical protein [Marilutibacter spongiae]|uniref:Lysozyme n=1 Tax=Marilutibacter spongiae TaxID=2025720 RepID=A0A7W3TKM0_9GAMM|nr:hypothetical protein [Lysobacter spongiae]MBB1060041.1 hypothetical protein [Lysobacter spongiae]